MYTLYLIEGAKKNSSYHIGYYRDAPDEDPSFVASNNGTDCKLTVTADNIIAALHHNLQHSRNKSKAKPVSVLIVSVVNPSTTLYFVAETD